MKPFVAVIETDKFCLNGIDIREAQPVKVFHELLGPPNRVQAAGGLAPIGHRNNQIHYYDDLGLYLNEHHYTYSIQAITFVLWHEEAAFVTDHEIIGELRVGGLIVKPGMIETDLRLTTIPFVSHLRGTWHFKSDDLWIGFDSKGKKGPSGRRSKTRYLTSLSVCLKFDPWNTRFRPPPES